MIFEGLKLMFVGMTTVLLFLSFMILLIVIVSKLTKGATARELNGLKLEREQRAAAKKKSRAAGQDTDDEIAAITAAVAAYEAVKFARS